MNVVKRFAFSMLVIVSCIIIVELLMRLFYLGNKYNFDPDNPSHTFIDGANQITIKEGFGIRSVNSYGTFDLDVKDVKEDDRYLLFGDSMTEAFQVSDSEVYDNIAEKIVFEKTGRNIEIVNLGRSGYGTIDEIVLYQHVAQKIKHKYVIVQFSSGDAIENTISSNKLVGGQIIPTIRSEKRTLIKSVFWFIKNHLVLVNSLHYRSDMLRNYINTWRDGKEIKKLDDNVDVRQISDNQAKLLQTLLYTFYTLVEQNGAKLIFIRIASEDTCIGSYNILRQFCTKYRVPYFELYDSQKDIEQDRDRFGFMNTRIGFGHMNEHGHKVTGDLLAIRLIEMENAK